MVTTTRLTALFAVTALSLIILALLQDQAIAETANRVREQASVRQYGHIDPRSADRTLSLLDHALKRVGTRWQPANGRLPIRVALYPNSREMESALDFPERRGLTLKGYVQCPEDGPVIHMPVHPNTPLLPDRNQSQAANHEAVHAWICQLVGPGAEGHVPLWLHEGLATSLQANRLERLGVINILRLGVTSQGLQTTDGAEFCYRLKNVGLRTYATATLFLRHLDAAWPQASYRILSEIAAGHDFATAFQTVTRTTCQAAYEEWAARR